MVKPFRRISRKAGLPPGSAVHVGDKKVDAVKISIIDYDKDHFEEKEASRVEECFPYREKPSITWIDIRGLHDVPIVEKLGSYFSIHPLIIEDLLNTEQRPKMDIFDEFIFVVIKMHSYERETREINSEQVSIIFGRNFVLTFQEKEGDVFDSIRHRIQGGKGRIRTVGADYLAYAVIDSVVDNYYKVLEGIGEEVEAMEDDIVKNPAPQTLQKIHDIKREIIYLRKSVWPLREVIGNLEREDSPLIRKTTKIYLRDLYDHAVQVIDTVETYRDIISGMLDVYLTSVSNRMNEIMKVLTIFAAIFIPLTFIAGIYGMNFNSDKSPLNMPELNWYFGYPFALGVMVAVGVTMVIYFRRKTWL